MIRLTFVTNNVRGVPREYDTDDLAEALTAEAQRGFRLYPDRPSPADNRGPDRWIVCFVVERDDHRYEQHELADAFRDIANIESVRGARRG